MPNTNENSSPLKIELRGYVPNTHNQLRGCHWSVLSREKKRAGMALLNALKSHSSSMPSDPAIGTTILSKPSKTCAAMLESYLRINGLFSAGVSSVERHIVKRKKKQKF